MKNHKIIEGALFNVVYSDTRGVFLKCMKDNGKMKTTKLKQHVFIKYPWCSDIFWASNITEEKSQV
jgi:hypothetical protein